MNACHSLFCEQQFIIFTATQSQTRSYGTQSHNSQ